MAEKLENPQGFLENLHLKNLPLDLQTSRQDCAFCSSFYHIADLCHIHTSPTARKQELKKLGRCQSCLKKHAGGCHNSSRCDYCGLYGHHRAICDHPEHIRKLAALRELAKPM